LSTFSAKCGAKMPGRHLSVRRKWRDCLCCLSEHVHRARNTSKDKRRFSETWYLSLSFSLAGVCSNFALKTRVCFNPLCLSPLALRSLSLSLFSYVAYDVRRTRLFSARPRKDIARVHRAYMMNKANKRRPFSMQARESYPGYKNTLFRNMWLLARNATNSFSSAADAGNISTVIR